MADTSTCPSSQTKGKIKIKETIELANSCSRGTDVSAVNKNLFIKKRSHSVASRKSFKIHEQNLYSTNNAKSIMPPYINPPNGDSHFFGFCA